MSLFSKPPLFLNKKERQIKKIPRIELEGKWVNLRSVVQGLIDDGWRVIEEPTPDENFIRTSIKLEYVVE